MKLVVKYNLLKNAENEKTVSTRNKKINARSV